MYNEDFRAGYNYTKQVMRERKLARIKQKAAGAALALLGIISVPLLDMDATAAVLFVPLGIYMLVSSEIYIDS